MPPESSGKTLKNLDQSGGSLGQGLETLRQLQASTIVKIEAKTVLGCEHSNNHKADSVINSNLGQVYSFPRTIPSKSEINVPTERLSRQDTVKDEHHVLFETRSLLEQRNEEDPLIDRILEPISVPLSEQTNPDFNG